MTIHRFVPSQHYNAIGSFPPALTVKSGDTIITETLDARGVDKAGNQITTGPNPMNGPIAVEGARPGDSLRVDIVRMTPIRDTGWTKRGLAEHVVDPDFVKQLPTSDLTIWNIDLTEKTVRLAEPSAALNYLTLPLHPMIGCMGVAPNLGQAISTATSGPHGGNMDYRLLGPGTSVSYPIAVDGGLLFLGDCHAAQGDGEIVGTGIETCFEVEIVVTIVPKQNANWPRGETKDCIFTLGNARPLNQALQHASTEMLHLLQSDYGLDVTDASHLMGQVVHYDVGNCYNPAYTIACRLEKKWLPTR